MKKHEKIKFLEAAIIAFSEPKNDFNLVSFLGIDVYLSGICSLIIASRHHDIIDKSFAEFLKSNMPPASVRGYVWSFTKTGNKQRITWLKMMLNKVKEQGV